MKPLELTWYDREESTGLYFLPGTLESKPAGNWSHIVKGKPTKKRFTDAELAAETHSQTVDWMRLSRDGYEFGEDFERAATLHRFATLPHYDEQP